MPDVWNAALRPELSQGDVLRQLPLGTVTKPAKYLRSASLKGQLRGWAETLTWTPDNNGVGHYLYRGKLASALVLSHDCEIDKPKDNHRVLVAVMIPREKLNAEEQAFVFGPQGARHQLPLLDVPDIGDHYADLRGTLFLPFEFVKAATRKASMSDAGVQRLQAQLIGFYTRLNISQLQAV